MIDKAERCFRAMRRAVSRSEWSRRLFQLPSFRGTAAEPGLLLIQMDGLSRRQFEKAMAAGRLPFLRKLLQKEHYAVRDLYSGLPSSTPAVQGELFYGARGAVPSFGFFDRMKGEIRRMFSQDAAREVEERIRGEGAGLLEGGSAYGTIYAGGAAESHFCAVDLGWETSVHRTTLWRKTAVLILNMASFFRMLALGLIEFALAWVDFFRGVLAGQSVWKELQFIPVRVAICVFLREFSVAGAAIDLARGLPVIHVNFLGYDEQAHRRGPSSRFAHWTLRGIDRSIRHLYGAALRSPNRDYSIWIFSDHGQEEIVAYAEMAGRTLRETVAAVLGKTVTDHMPPPPAREGGESSRAGWTGWSRWSRAPALTRDSGGDDRIVVLGPGPVGHLHWPVRPSRMERRAVARRLVREALVPLILTMDGEDRVWAVNKRREFILPRDARELLGEAHPFWEEAGEDLVALVTHRFAGDLVLMGWRGMGRRPVSFAMENGAHGGPGPDECHGLLMVPADTELGPAARNRCLRPFDLRMAALHHLKRESFPARGGGSVPRGSSQSLRIMTYNVHRCLGIDAKISPGRIARVIARERPDIVALQEIDVGRARSGFIDQARMIAGLLEMEFHFHPAFEIEDEKYGLAVLSHYPMRLVRSGPLPGLPGRPGLETRGAQWVEIDYHGREIQLVNTHLGLLPGERRRQVEAILGEEWLGGFSHDEPVVICGDMNSLPASFVHRRVSTRLLDVQTHSPFHWPRRTFYGRYPLGRIDHIFVSSHFAVNGFHVPRHSLAKVSSDHLPLCAELNLPAVKAQQRGSG